MDPSCLAPVPINLKRPGPERTDRKEHRRVSLQSCTFLLYTDGEAVIMLAFQASGRGSTPLQCIVFTSFIFLPKDPSTNRSPALAL